MREQEAEKGNLDRVPDPRFPKNMVVEVLKAEWEHRYVIIPTVWPVMSMLQKKFGRDIILVYPKKELKEEYRQRYLARGNSQGFLELFIDGWERRLDAFEGEDAPNLRVRLGSGQYLSDALPQLDTALAQCTAPPVSQETLDTFAAEVEKRSHQFALCRGVGPDRFVLPLSNLDDPATVDFLCNGLTDGVGGVFYSIEEVYSFLSQRYTIHWITTPEEWRQTVDSA